MELIAHVRGQAYVTQGNWNIVLVVASTNPSDKQNGAPSVEGAPDLFQS